MFLICRGSCKRARPHFIFEILVFLKEETLNCINFVLLKTYLDLLLGINDVKMRPEYEPKKNLFSFHRHCFRGKLNLCVYSFTHSFYYSFTYVTDIYEAPNMPTICKILEEIQRIWPQLSGSRPSGGKKYNKAITISSLKTFPITELVLSSYWIVSS